MRHPDNRPAHQHPSRMPRYLARKSGDGAHVQDIRSPGAPSVKEFSTLGEAVSWAARLNGGR